MNRLELEQFIRDRAEWIGGYLRDEDTGKITVILDITLETLSLNDSFFHVKGIDFPCGFDTQSADVAIESDKHTATFNHSEINFSLEKNERMKCKLHGKQKWLFYKSKNCWLCESCLRSGFFKEHIVAEIETTYGHNLTESLEA